MNTTFREEDQKYVMTFEGRLDTASTAQVKKDIKALDNCEGHDIILDCSQLTYICSSGLRLFLAVLKNARSKGSRTIITGLNDEMYDVFVETGFTQLFETRRK
ncbi:MAG: STAS domain-containing protein [Prevotella sp.]|nr:STAS domain-containing protein [Prevotella sp.]